MRHKPQIKTELEKIAREIISFKIKSGRLQAPVFTRTSIRKNVLSSNKQIIESLPPQKLAEILFSRGISLYKLIEN